MSFLYFLKLFSLFKLFLSTTTLYRNSSGEGQQDPLIRGSRFSSISTEEFVPLDYVFLLENSHFPQCPWCYFVQILLKNLWSLFLILFCSYFSKKIIYISFTFQDLILNVHVFFTVSGLFFSRSTSTYISNPSFSPKIQTLIYP